MTHTNKSLLLSLAAATSLACSHGGTAKKEGPSAAPPPGQAAAGEGMGAMSGMCPMDVPGAQLSASDTPSGSALTFTTTSPDQVANLRQRVRAMAAMHDQHHATGAGGMADAHAGMAEGMPPPSKTSVEDVEKGARVDVTPNDPADLQKLQSTVRAHAEQIQQHGCAAMMHHAPAHQ
jgi:hypothetical protein